MMLTAIPVPSDEKFIELLLYIARRSENDSKFGAVKLNKLMFYCDFLTYQSTGKSITGHTYKKLPNGPAPKAMLPILKRLKQSGVIREEERQYFNRIQKRVVVLREPNVSVFNANEISRVESVIEALKDGNATEVSDLSHDFIGWKAAALHEDIPYQIAMIDGTPEADERDIAFAESLKQEASRLLAGG